MSEELVVRLCAPTLAGLKTGSLFSAEYTSEAEFQGELKQLNQRLQPKGLCALALRYGVRSVLVYIYRPDRLKVDLSGDAAKHLLNRLGYKTTSPESCIAELQSRVQDEKKFPHEIGLFLSYPPEDVQGFIDNKAQSYKCVGTWKVYGDPERAQKTFNLYKHCTDVYCRSLKKGRSFDRLLVPGHKYS